jgi:hypothetical protein
MGKDKEKRVDNLNKQHHKTERQPQKPKWPFGRGITVPPDFKEKLEDQVLRIKRDFGID